MQNETDQSKISVTRTKSLARNLVRITCVARGYGGLDPRENTSHACIHAREPSHGTTIAPRDNSNQSIATIDLCKIWESLKH